MSKRDVKSELALVLAVSTLLMFHPMPSFADEELSAEQNTANSATVEGKSEADSSGSVQTSSSELEPAERSKLTIHGFLSQAAAIANFVGVPEGVRPDGTVGPLGFSPDAIEISLGIREDVTTDYRFLALQFRYDFTPKDVFVLQLSHRDLGFSELQNFTDEVALDWAFYERKLGDQTRLKIGRVQIPFGIYNELRDVGTVLPFFRVSNLYYKEQAFTSETVDGISLSHRFFANSDWNLDVSAYAGEWTTILIVPGSNLTGEVRIKDGYGYQLWLNTPSDIRIGTGLVSFKHDGGPIPVIGRRNIFHASVDIPIGRFTVQGEWQWGETDVDAPPLGIVTVKPSEWYVLAGYRFTEKFSLWGQYEESWISQDADFFLDPTNGRTLREDQGVSLNYAFTPNLVLKGEYHWISAADTNGYPDFSTGMFKIRNELWKSVSDGNVAILSISVSF